MSRQRGWGWTGPLHSRSGHPSLSRDRFGSTGRRAWERAGGAPRPTSEDQAWSWMRQRLAVRPPGIRKGHRLVCAGTGRFPAPRIARTERLPVGETAKVHWRPCNLWELTPRERQRSCGSESFRAPLPRARWRARLSPLRILPPEIFFTAVFAPRTGPSVRSGSASARRGLPHPGVRGERQKFSPAGAPDGSACPLRGTRRGNNRWHDFPLRRRGRDSHRDRDCQALLPL